MYTEHQFNLPTLRGLSEGQIMEHLKLYAGYVKNTNTLLAKLHDAEAEIAPDLYLIAELRRRLGFEWNGMRLHELYFSALGGTETAPGAVFRERLAKTFGSYETWLARFKTAGLARGVGWVLLVHDKTSGLLENIWVSDHDVGHLIGTETLLAMDVWEHAFLLDYLPSQRKEYIEAFFDNLDWVKIERRLTSL